MSAEDHAHEIDEFANWLVDTVDASNFRPPQPRSWPSIQMMDGQHRQPSAFLHSLLAPLTGRDEVKPENQEKEDNQ